MSYLNEKLLKRIQNLSNDQDWKQFNEIVHLFLKFAEIQQLVQFQFLLEVCQKKSIFYIQVIKYFNRSKSRFSQQQYDLAKKRWLYQNRGRVQIRKKSGWKNSVFSMWQQFKSNIWKSQPAEQTYKQQINQSHQQNEQQFPILLQDFSSRQENEEKQKKKQS